MKKLSEYRGEEALDVLADLIEPAAEIMRDKEVAAVFREKNAAGAISIALKKHKKAVLSIMARLEGENPDTYAPSVLALPMKLMDILNDPEFASLFTSQGQITEKTNSGSVSVTTEAPAE